MGRLRARVWMVVMAAAWAIGRLSAGEQPTTPTRTLGGELGDLVRQRLAPYQPLADQLRKRSATELQKLGQWEHRVIAVRTSDTVVLTAALDEWGEQGWECFHVVSSAPLAAGALPTEHLLFFRKHKVSWLTQIPIRDLLRLLLYFASESGQGPSTP